MSIRNMDSLFEPGSVAIFGASLRPDRMGTQVMNNMAESGFAGAIWPSSVPRPRRWPAWSRNWVPGARAAPSS
jgi:hypothetical protein